MFYKNRWQYCVSLNPRFMYPDLILDMSIFVLRLRLKKKEEEQRFFCDFSRFFPSGFGWTGELWSNRVFLKLRNKEYLSFIYLFQTKYYFLIFLFFEKKCFFFKDFRFFLTIFHVFQILWEFFVVDFLKVFGFFWDVLDFFENFRVLGFFLDLLGFLDSFQSY